MRTTAITVLAVFAVCALIVLVSCGGGSGPPSPTDPPAVSREQASVLTAGEVETLIDALLRNSDSVQPVSSIFPNSRVRLWFPVEGRTYTLQDIVGDVEGALVHAADPIGWAELKTVGSGHLVEAHWGEHFAAFARLEPGQVHYAWLAGTPTGSNPAGPLTWTGRASAGHMETGEKWTGTATITVSDLSQVDVSVRLDPGDLGYDWSGVPLTGGVFEAGDMSGRFYGPGHEEVAGRFTDQRDKVAGIFGAVR